VSHLTSLYSAVVVATGASEDRNLNVPGEDLTRGVLSARSFVNWYNGHPSYQDLPIDLNTERAVVFGQGNVAIDVARILLSPIEHLAKTDISERALTTLRQSKVREVHLVGRRGPLQVSC
jgi:adrenodoxin-NADP+ reductase